MPLVLPHLLFHYTGERVIYLGLLALYILIFFMDFDKLKTIFNDNKGKTFIIGMMIVTLLNVLASLMYKWIQWPVNVMAIILFLFSMLAAKIHDKILDTSDG